MEIQIPRPLPRASPSESPRGRPRNWHFRRLPESLLTFEREEREGPGKPADPLAALGFGRKPPAQLLNLLGVLEGSVDPTLGELHWRSGDPLFREKNLLHWGCLDQMPLCEPTDPMTFPMQFLFLLPGRKMLFTSYDGGLRIHFQREMSIEARRSSEGQPPTPHHEAALWSASD